MQFANTSRMLTISKHIPSGLLFPNKRESLKFKLWTESGRFYMFLYVRQQTDIGENLLRRCVGTTERLLFVIIIVSSHWSPVTGECRRVKGNVEGRRAFCIYKFLCFHWLPSSTLLEALEKFCFLVLTFAIRLKASLNENIATSTWFCELQDFRNFACDLHCEPYNLWVTSRSKPVAL